MRAIVSGLLFLGMASAAADDKAGDKLDEKFLVGKWSMVSVLDPAPKKKTAFSNVPSGTIEFKGDGTYVMKNDPVEFKGTYALKGTTLVLTRDGKPFQEWKDLSVKDGKMYQPLSKESKMVFTRSTETDKKKGKN
ncbi:MAG: lipocalin family protein [Planctomycetes bacterium]|nr:lipocalin family protein [Planctomycetota bacterium]